MAPIASAPARLALITFFCLTGPASAQIAGVPQISVPTAFAESADPAEALGRYLRVLSSNPRHLESLIGAGRAALASGDPQAAIGFFGRGEELAPKNGAILAGLGSAMVQLEQPKPALRMFEEAVDAGIAPMMIAADRGLAHDLRGENRKAQADYALALQGRDDPETVRRMALSLAISGDRAGALAALDPQLRAQDRAGWRTRAFVLGLTGDALGASAAAQQAMPGEAGTEMGSFLGRLAPLRAAQKAAAVHFGRLPGDGRLTTAPMLADARGASPTYPARRADAGLIPAGEPLGGPSSAPVTAASMAALIDKVEARASSVPVQTSEPAEPLATKKPAKSVNAKKVELATAETETSSTKAGTKKPEAKKAAAKVVPKPSTPERYWVQIASGANKADLGKVWGKHKAAQAKLLSGKSAWTARWRASNRLLTGPFDSEAEAQGFVNTLAKSGMSAIQFTTRAGTEVEKLPTS